MPDITLPTPGVTPGPQYAEQINGAIEAVNAVIEVGRLSSDEIQETITDVVTPLLSTAGLVIIEHGSNPSALRLNAEGQTFTSPALWVGSVPPSNRIAGDFYFESSLVPSPVTIWSETIPADGPLGTTEVGALPWQVFGTGYAGAKSGGRLVFTSGTTSLGALIVDDGQTNLTYRVTISTRGTTFSAGVVIRWQNISNHLILNRTSATDATYRLSSRSGGTYTHLAVLTGHLMTDGDQFEIVTLNDGSLTIRLNGSQIYTGTVSNYATTTARGVFCLLPGEATTVSYDNLSVTSVV